MSASSSNGVSNSPLSEGQGVMSSLLISTAQEISEEKSSLFPRVHPLSTSPPCLFSGLPDSLWSHVMTFIPDQRSMARMGMTCRHLHCVTEKEKEKYYRNVRQHPTLAYLDQLIDPENKSSYKKKMPVFKLFLDDAAMIEYETEGRFGRELNANFSFSRRVPWFIDTISTRLQHPDGNLDPRDPVRELVRLADQIKYSHIFLTSIVLGKNQQFNLECMDRKMVDYAAYFFLHKGRYEDFRKVLPHTSIFDGHDNDLLSWDQVFRCEDVLGAFLELAAKKDNLELFSDLLDLRKPFCPNRLLVKFARLDLSETMVKVLLQKKRDWISKEFINNNGHNISTSERPGLHTALMWAAIDRNQSVLKAILEEFPNKEVHREILEQLLALLTTDDHSLLPIHVARTLIQQGDYNDIMDLLKQEIESRYPAPIHLEEKKEEPSPENAAQIAPLNQGVDLQGEGVALAPQQALGQTDHLQAVPEEMILPLPDPAFRREEREALVMFSAGALALVVASVAGIVFQYFVNE